MRWTLLAVPYSLSRSSFLNEPSFTHASFALACVLSRHARSSMRIHVFDAGFGVLIDVGASSSRADPHGGTTSWCHLFDLQLRFDVAFSPRTDKTACVSSSPAHTPRAPQLRACPTSTYGPASLRPCAPPLSCVARLQVDSRLRPCSPTRPMHVARALARPYPTLLYTLNGSSFLPPTAYVLLRS